MTTFCNCSSKWILGYHTNSVGRQIQVNLDKNTLKCLPSSDECPKCNYFFWYDADYENMMFDLRRMNV